jgi:Skp family chaperone for outer membrane proteins
MQRLGVYLVLAGCVVNMTGCGKVGGGSASSHGGMAVVDLDKVAADTGRDRQLGQSLELRQNSLNQSYAKIVENAREQLETKKKGLGTAPSEDEQKEFVLMQRSAETQLIQIQNRAKADYEQYKQQQIAKFRAELKPITQEIAAKRGLSIVIPKNEGLLLSVDPGVDITEEVVKVLRERHPVVAASAQPQAEETSKSSAKPSSAKSAAAARTAAAAEEEDTEEETR